MTLRLSKEVEGSIFGVKGIEGSDGIVYAKVVSCAEVKDYSCDVIGVFLMIVIIIHVHYGIWFCRYEQAAIEGK